MKKSYVFAILTLLFIGCSTEREDVSSSNGQNCGWQQVFANDEDGNSVFGQKPNLVEAVRSGYDVRVGFGEKPIEHYADAKFLTVIDGQIIQGEVFAQIETIVGQLPEVENDSLKLRFRTWNHWTKMVATTGYSTAIMTDYQTDTLVNGNVDRKAAIRWFVDYPCDS